MNQPIADQAGRERALDPLRSFIVQAPAGSGKTDLLIRRYLVLLGRVQKPEEILAITFTRKAAAEMRKRVLESLPNAAEIAHRLRIMTIDAFCASLTRQMPVLARFGAQPEIVEDARELYLEAAGRALAGLDPPAARFLAHLDNNVAAATGLLAAMLAKRDQWLRKTGAAPTRAELEAALASERQRLLDKAKALDTRASKDFAQEVLTRQGTWRTRSQVAQAIADNEPLRQPLAALLDMPPARYTDSQWQALDAILKLLPLAAAQLKLVFAERGQADFTEIAQGAVRALGAPDDPTDLLLALDHRIRHILVDEFQDTSISQWELLERLTAGWEGEDEMRGDGRTLFLVGDPMQSIYRFREAEVGLFLHARRAGVGAVKLEPLTLSTNFRSHAGLVAWFNDSFSKILPAEEDEAAGAVPYAPSSPRHPALSGDAVAWHCFHDRGSEASKVVELIRNSPGKTSILVRNRNHLDAIVPALKDAGIHFRAVEIEQLGEKQVVQDLYALTRALSHPGDRIAWLAILRAPWCGLDLNDLHTLVAPLAREAGEGPGERATIWELMNDDLVVCKLSEDGRRRLMRAWEPIGQAMIHRLRGTLRDRVEGAWLALGGPACVEDATDLEDAEIFLDELERLEEAGDVRDMAALAGSLEELYALPDVNAGPDAVDIMTIHKAKGLEFDTVIVPGLDRAPRHGDPPLLVWKSLTPLSRTAGEGPGERGPSLLLAPIRSTGEKKDPAYEYVRGLDREAEDIEAGRLFYVAATRAQSRLHLLACATRDEDGAAKRPAMRSLLAKIWFEAEQYFPSPAAAGEGQGERVPLTGRGAGGEGTTLRRLPADFALPAAPAPATWSASEEGRDEEQIEFSWAGETARHVGTVVHRWLQRIAGDEVKGWDAKRVESLRAAFERDLYRRGVQNPGPAAELVVTAVRNSIADERGRWILGPHPEAKSEYRLRTAARGFIIDRLLRDKEGRRWVVDFKTSRHEGANVEGFLDEERKRYAAQLDAYAAALGGASRGLYFPLHAGWRAW
ncbi:MAG: UvrD-helicase domain-containing protein [Burkholderiales bacterium]